MVWRRLIICIYFQVVAGEWYRGGVLFVYISRGVAGEWYGGGLLFVFVSRWLLANGTGEVYYLYLFLGTGCNEWFGGGLLFVYISRGVAGEWYGGGLLLISASRWLLANGKVEEAEQLCRKIAR